MARGQSGVAPIGDTQLWPEIQATIELNRRASLVLFGTVRPGRNLTANVDDQAGVGFSFKLSKYLTVSPLYRYIVTSPAPHRHLHEHRFFCDTTIRIPLGAGFAIADRNRTELRNVEGVISERYRQRLMFERKFNFGEHEVTPYIAEEVFYDSRFHHWTRNRVNIGARLPLAKHLALDCYYLYQHDERLRPYKVHAVNIRFNLDF